MRYSEWSGMGLEADLPSNGKGVVEHRLEDILCILLLSGFFGSLGISCRDRSSECHFTGCSGGSTSRSDLDPNLNQE